MLHYRMQAVFHKQHSDKYQEGRRSVEAGPHSNRRISEGLGRRSGPFKIRRYCSRFMRKVSCTALMQRAFLLLFAA